MVIATFNNYKKQHLPKVLIDAIDDALPLFKDTLPENGKYALKNNVFAYVSRYNTNEYSNVSFESHEIMTDIQIILEGEEYLYVTENTNLTPNKDISQDDLEFYHEHPQEYARAHLNNQSFCIIYPNEAHAPTIMVNESIPVVKIVLKVPMG